MKNSKSPFLPVRALIFDMDGTLYRNEELTRRYDQSMYAFLAAQKKISLLQARQLFKTTYAYLHRKKKKLPSKLFTLNYLGVSDTVWAKQHGAQIRPEKYLRKNHKLIKTLQALRENFRLAIVTNNHDKNMRRTLDALGITACFDRVSSLSDSRIYKPHISLYRSMAEKLRVDPESCLSIGDRYDLDLAPAAEIGMQTLLVQKMQDIYQLAEILTPFMAKRIKMKGNMPVSAAITEAVRVLRQEKLVILPTDTVYGLAGKLTPEVIEWIYRAKGRPDDNPMPILLSGIQQAEKYAEISPKVKMMLKRYWPGAVTFVLPVKKGTPWGKITRGKRTIALRVPEHPVARQVIQRAGGALAVTSANRSGETAPRSADKISKKILAFSSVLLDAGSCRQGIHSTVVRIIHRKVEVLRQGSINFKL